MVCRVVNSVRHVADSVCRVANRVCHAVDSGCLVADRVCRVADDYVGLKCSWVRLLSNTNAIWREMGVVHANISRQQSVFFSVFLCMPLFVLFSFASRAIAVHRSMLQH